ncbi:hypothetical protein [Devosia sp. 2618]|uniref:hypothetical protein n=1 Tax=Devosia sp. 2618 TaxID=3156454 RepID=UPI003392DBF2
MDHISPAEIFPHVRILLGTIIGLGMARLLMTVAGIIQHPTRAKISVLHLLWVVSLVIELVLFWWWEFALYHLQVWTFATTFFLITYAICLFLLAAVLSPDSVSDYEGYEDFFLKRRKWFFGLFAVVAVLDVIDTVMKGSDHLALMGPGYILQSPAGLIVCLIGFTSSNRGVHLAIVGTHFAYQLFLMGRYFTIFS